MRLSEKHPHGLSPWLIMAQPSLSTAQREHIDLTTHSAACPTAACLHSPSLAAPSLSWWTLLPPPGSTAGLQQPVSLGTRPSYSWKKMRQLWHMR